MNCFCSEARRASRRLTRLYEEELRPAGLTPSQFELMGTLIARAGVSQAELVDQLGADQTTLSRNLGLLVARKWVRSKASKEDRRVLTYALSASGKATWHSAEPHWRRAQERVQQDLGPDFQRMMHLLHRLGSGDVA